MAEGITNYSEEHLFQCLKSLNVPVSLSVVKTPTREFMVQVFHCCLKDFKIDLGHPDVRPFDAVKHFENPELFEDAQMLTLMVIAMNVIVNNYKGVTICHKDITDPKPKRTKKILTILVHFWTHYLKKGAAFSAIEESLEEERKEGEQLIEENEALEEKIQELLAALDSMEPNMEELTDQIEKKRKLFQEYKKEKETLSNESNALKKEENELKNQVTAIDVNIVSLKEQIQELDELILTSPDKLGAQLQRLKESIKSEELKTKEKEGDFKEKKKSLEAQMKLREENEKALAVLEEMQKEWNDISEGIQEYLTDHKNSSDEEILIQKFQYELDTKQKYQEIYEQRAVQSQLNTKKQREAVLETLRMLQSNVTEAQNLLTTFIAEISESEHRTDEEIQLICDIIDRCKKAKELSEEKFIEYELLIGAIVSQFVSDCDEIKQYVNKFCH